MVAMRMVKQPVAFVEQCDHDGVRKQLLSELPEESGQLQTGHAPFDLYRDLHRDRYRSQR